MCTNGATAGGGSLDGSVGDSGWNAAAAQMKQVPCDCTVGEGAR